MNSKVFIADYNRIKHSSTQYEQSIQLPPVSACNMIPLH